MSRRLQFGRPTPRQKKRGCCGKFYIAVVVETVSARVSHGRCVKQVKTDRYNSRSFPSSGKRFFDVWSGTPRTTQHHVRWIPALTSFVDARCFPLRKSPRKPIWSLCRVQIDQSACKKRLESVARRTTNSLMLTQHLQCTYLRTLLKMPRGGLFFCAKSCASVFCKSLAIYL